MLLEALFEILRARAALLLVPLKNRRPGLSPPADADLLTRLRQGNEADRRCAEEVSWAVTRVALHLPVGALCLAQALAARAMLRRRRISSIVHIGVTRTPTGSFAAHAWLEAVGIELTGYPVDNRFRQAGRGPLAPCR
ncbi:MAG TPA: lasso peptide biosynthesis B2 protein [Allosphingosinicella sp.]|nr:lasso peptide biosynthesis B2 protein [Allosphingosinicella sp.]